jgi:transposase
VQLVLDELQLIEQHRDQLDHEIADLLSRRQAAVHRVAEVPGLGVDSAHQIIAEREFEKGQEAASRRVMRRIMAT